MRQVFIIPFLAMFALPAQAQPIKPPPDPQHFSSRPIHQNLVRWYENLTTDCILAVRDDAQINRIAGQISKHQAQPDQGIYVNYFNKSLLPLYNALLAGVPGYGTYAEIDAHREAATKFLNEQLPKGPAGTEAEIRSFVASYQAYIKRAAEERKWLMGLHKLSACHREQRFENITMLKGFHNLNRFTDPAMVKARLAELRNPLVPHFGGMAELEGFFQKLESPKEEMDLFFYGQLVMDAVRTFKTLGEVETQFAVLPLWAEIFEGDEKAELVGRLARITELKKKVFIAIGTIFNNIEPPAAKAEKSLLGTAKSLVKASGVLSIRITSSKGTYNGSVTQYKKVTETKVLVRTVPIKYDHFGISYVSNERPYQWWPDLPGLPATDVCTLVVGVAKKYSKGVDVQLGKWLFYPNDNRIPILCKNKDAAGKPL
ncbi:hypothetical protein KJ612_17810 [Myxococcota bacterium]|nr:hypothetical protein [Myxococcota bacterium]